MKSNIQVIAENEHWVAIAKPAGMLSIPDREQSAVSLKDLLQVQYGKVFVVHRLDKFTSGLILFAKDEATHKHLSQQFEQRVISKEYIGIVHGTPNPASGSIDAPIMEHPLRKGEMITHRKGKPSLTTYEVIQSLGMYGLVKFHIYTGRTHQIRVHMKHIGHPIVCDEIYGSPEPILLSSIKRKKFKLAKNAAQEHPLLNRLALHAWKLNFTDVHGEKVFLEAPLPKDLKATIHQLEKWTH